MGAWGWRLLTACAGVVLLTACGAPTASPRGPAPSNPSGRSASAVAGSTARASARAVQHTSGPPNSPAPTRATRHRAVRHRAVHRAVRHRTVRHRAVASAAATLLAGLAVKGRAPMTGYARTEFGPAWLDANRNGCDTRNDVLTRDLTRRAYRPGTRGCVVVAGDLAEPYTARTVHFVRGEGDLVDIDHVVALGNAWATGASWWPIRERAALANDPMNLLAVDASANRQKGDGDAATWLPPNRGYRCSYVARQVSVKAKYHLWVTPAERAAAARVLAGCPGQDAVPDSGAPVLAPVRVPEPSRPTREAPHVESSPGGAVSYQNCDAVRAAGADPIHRGDPGYATHLDRDGDGTGCE